IVHGEKAIWHTEEIAQTKQRAESSLNIVLGFELVIKPPDNKHPKRSPSSKANPMQLAGAAAATRIVMPKPPPVAALEAAPTEKWITRTAGRAWKGAKWLVRKGGRLVPYVGWGVVMYDGGLLLYEGGKWLYQYAAGDDNR